MDNTGTATLIGMPLDFRNTLKHINTHGGFPRLQRLIQRLARAIFPADTLPLRFAVDAPGDRFASVACSMASSTGEAGDTSPWRPR